MFSISKEKELQEFKLILVQLKKGNKEQEYLKISLSYCTDHKLKVHVCALNDALRSSRSEPYDALILSEG